MNTKHLIGSTNSFVDSENLFFDLASTNGTLAVQNLAKAQVERFYGDIFAWSAVWTNELLTTIDVITNGTSSGAVTNTIEIGYHALIVGGQMNTLKSVLVQEFAARSTNVTISDTMTVDKSLLIDAENLTLTGNLSLGQTAFNWNAVVAPQLAVFTNSGSLTVPNEANFGADRAAPYARMVNQGSINAFVAKISADEFDNSGSIVTTGDISVETRSGKLDSGAFTAGGNIDLSGGNIKVRAHTISATGGLFVRVTDVLTDAGLNGTSSWNVQNGFHLLTKPARGDLFGVTLSSFAPYFANPLHSWAAEDRGATPAGYSNNVVIGVLSLDANTEGLLTFSSVDARNALYVDFLNLGSAVANNLTNTLEILPGLVIYFAAANVPAEQLDGQLGGRLGRVRPAGGAGIDA